VLYYLDERSSVPAGEAIGAVRARIAAARATGGHDALMALLVDASALAQGIADAQRELVGRDEDSGLGAMALKLVRAAASAVWSSWNGGRPSLVEADAALGPLARAPDLPPFLPLRVAEGYAHYGVFPELFGEAARRLGGAPRLVIGIRTIGVGLAAMVAAASGGGEVVTVRPIGPPFDRRIELGAGLAARLRAAIAARARFAVVDEGPGLSGSSFAAVARWLASAGCPPDHVALFPGHAGPPGRAASVATRAWWERTPRHVIEFAEELRPRLEAWASRALGAAKLSDLSGGAWRAYVPGARDVPVFRQQERLKLLARGPCGAHLLRFAGLGGHLEEAHARARAVAEAGFAPPSIVAAHGFLAQRWIDGRPPEPGDVPRERWLSHLGRYLALRARMPPAARSRGDPGALLEALRVNAREALGDEAASAADAFAEGAAVAAALPRCAIDGKLERWEWVVTSDGALAKLDAVDHASSHDLAGAQPVGWDVAAAALELDLGAGAARELAGRVADEGGGATPAPALAFLEAAYLAHRVGRWTFALETEGDAAERGRIVRILDRYRRLLASALARPGGADPE
jgi:hypothetical protein